MGKSSQATQAKRQRERNQQERQQEKRSEKALRKEQKKSDRLNGIEGEDPDLAGIVPGPQAPQDF